MSSKLRDRISEFLAGYWLELDPFMRAIGWAVMCAIGWAVHASPLHMKLWKKQAGLTPGWAGARERSPASCGPGKCRRAALWWAR